MTLEVHKRFEADVFFPEIDFSKFKLIESEFVKTDEMTDFDFTYETYLKKV